MVVRSKKAKKETVAGVRLIGGKEYDISEYARVKTSAGHVSFDNGDPVAEKLRGKELDSIYDLVAKKTKIPEDELRKRFKKLNQGMQRMCLGNMLRKASRVA